MIAYPYSRRNDELSGTEIRGLSAVSKQARLDAEAAALKAKSASDEADAAKAESGGARQVASAAESVAHGARQEADSFEKDISIAKTQATEAESHLAEALRQAAEAQRELNELTAWRTLSLEQQAKISDAVKRFAGTEFLLTVNPTPEAIHLAGEIAASLLAAHRKWTSVDSLGLPGINIVTKTDKGGAAIWYRSGLTVLFRPLFVDTTRGFPEAAQALVSILRTQNIGDVGREQIGQDAGLSYVSPGAILVVVGCKP